MRRMITAIKRDSRDYGIPSGGSARYKSFEVYFDTILPGNIAAKNFDVKGIPISPVGDRTLVHTIAMDKVSFEWYDEDMEVISSIKPSYLTRIYWGDAGDILIGFGFGGGAIPSGATSVKLSFTQDNTRVHLEATPIDLIVI